MSPHLILGALAGHFGDPLLQLFLGYCLGTEWVPTRRNKTFGTQTKRDSKSRKVVATQYISALLEMRQNIKIPARNEKVACSSQVTSSTKKP